MQKCGHFVETDDMYNLLHPPKADSLDCLILIWERILLNLALRITKQSSRLWAVGGWLLYCWCSWGMVALTAGIHWCFPFDSLLLPLSHRCWNNRFPPLKQESVRQSPPLPPPPPPPPNKATGNLFSSTLPGHSAVCWSSFWLHTFLSVTWNRFSLYSLGRLRLLSSCSVSQVLLTQYAVLWLFKWEWPPEAHMLHYLGSC